MILPPFNESTPCAKCGHGWASTDYHASQQAELSCPGCFVATQLEPAEHFERRCSRCGFRWLEAILPPNEKAIP